MKLYIKDVTKQFDKQKIVNHANFTFEKGKIYGLLGRNGAGKTTLFNMIAKSIPIDLGTISLEKEGVEKDQYDNTEVSLVHATPHLPGFLTGYEFIQFFLDIHRKKMKKIESPSYYLHQVGIETADHHRLLKDYSYGMQNKVQMVVSMMAQAPIVLLDEPLTSFDVVAAHEMKELIVSLKDESIVIFSTHILQLAQDLCDEIVLLHNGQLSGIPAYKIHDKDFEKEVVHLLSEKGDEVRHD